MIISAPRLPTHFIGLMSGTSLDGVDGVLVDFSATVLGKESSKMPVIAARAAIEFVAPLRAELLALNTPGGMNELHRAAVAANGLALAYAQVVQALLAQTGLAAQDICAIGAHGQTVRHVPEHGAVGQGYTLQLNNPSLLAERTGIAVVADFRSRDVAAGGQGAPLVPAFHRAAFSHADARGAVLNLGGIGNLSFLDSASPVAGFDTGPGNVLMDLWAQQHLGQAFDALGAWAATGQVQHALLEHLLQEPYFARKAPKSTGRDLFHTAWLAAQLASFQSLAAQDVQATLCELTARSVRSGMALHAPHAEKLLVCGGGAQNEHLMRRLAALLPTLAVHSTQDFGVAPQDVEAMAFAWLARERLAGRPGNLPQATGASGPRVLGGVFSA